METGDGSLSPFDERLFMMFLEIIIPQKGRMEAQGCQKNRPCDTM